MAWQPSAYALFVVLFAAFVCFATPFVCRTQTVNLCGACLITRIVLRACLLNMFCDVRLSLQDTKNFEFDEWNGVAVTPYLARFLGEEDSEAVTRAYLARAVEEAEREAAANAPVLVSSVWWSADACRLCGHASHCGRCLASNCPSASVLLCLSLSS
jgi:hypothetical protein